MKRNYFKFFSGFIVSIFIMYIIPIFILYPSILNVRKLQTNDLNQNSSYIQAVDRIQNSGLGNELKTFNDTAFEIAKVQINVRNYIIVFYAVMLFITLIILGLYCIKRSETNRFLGKGIIIGSFIGAGGFVATALFSLQYFIA